MSDLDVKTIIETENISLQDYIRQMRSNATWGGAIEIKAFCDIYNVNVLVRNIRNENRDPNTPDTIEFLCNNNTNRLVEITWNGGHFEPVLE